MIAVGIIPQPPRRKTSSIGTLLVCAGETPGRGRWLQAYNRAMKPWRTLRTVVAVSIPVVAATTLAVVGLCAFRVCVPRDVLVQSEAAVGNYLQTLGTIYAVLLAFVVYVVWNQFNEARALVEREANEVIDLYRTALGLPDPARGHLQTALTTYVEAVLDREWRAMATRDEATSEQVGKILDGV